MEKMNKQKSKKKQKWFREKKTPAKYHYYLKRDKYEDNIPMKQEHNATKEELLFQRVWPEVTYFLKEDHTTIMR